MKKIRLVVEKRELCGSSASGRLRKTGSIPAVIYGPSGVKHLQVLKPDFRKMMLEKGESAALVELVCGSESILSMMQASQRNPRTDDYLHVDFKEIDPNKPMIASVPLHFLGTPAGVKDEGGILDIAKHTISVSCLPENLPEAIEIDINALGLGHSIHVKNLPQVKGVTYKTHAEDVVVSCVAMTEEEEEATGEASEETAENAPAEGEKAESAPADDKKTK